MRYLSVCSGIGADTVAWRPLGWDCAGFAEIDRFPNAVLSHRFPETLNFGDFRDIEREDVGQIDILVGGTPCTAFSIAGKRKGLDAEAGNLTLDFCLLADQLRPRWIVWENVPGVLSLDDGETFGEILSAMEGCGYSCAWRVLDARYVRVESHPCAVPQRRRRVFVVGYLGDWRPAATVLLEPECLRRGVAPGGSKGKVCAPYVAPNPIRGIEQLVATGFYQDGTQSVRFSGPVSATAGPKPDSARNYVLTVNDRPLVRRFTPTECERLMGFPDGWTNVWFGRRRMSDTARYRILGNSIAVNCMRWIGERIQMFEEAMGETNG